MKKIILCLLIMSSPVMAARWIKVDGGWSNPDCWFLSVPHGWLSVCKDGYGVASSFLPDEQHELKIKISPSKVED